MTKERPMLFSTPMVQALLAGTKTMTRRIVKDTVLQDGKYPEDEEFVKLTAICPYGFAGDRIWVRETVYQNGELGLSYKADNESIDENIIPDDYGPYGGSYSFRNIPNIHMPKWAARIWLEITEIKLERLQDISEEDAKAEGVERLGLYPGYDISNRGKFEGLWGQINGTESWDKNPWVWVVKFKKINKGE